MLSKFCCCESQLCQFSFADKSSSVLGWKERVQIALDAASGK